MILRLFQYAAVSKPKTLQKIIVNQNSYDDDIGRTYDDDNLDDNSDSLDEECDVDDLKIIDAKVDDYPEIDYKSNIKKFKPPKDIIVNASIYSKKQIDAPEKLNNSEENFFEINSNEFDGYHEIDNYGYEQEDDSLGECKEVKRCIKACHTVYKTLCKEFKCKKTKIIFKQACQEKCEGIFSDRDRDIEDTSGEYYDDY